MTQERPQVSFGKDKDGFWTSYNPSQLIEQYSSDIKKFGYFLKLVKWTMPLLGLVPIRSMLRLMFFSKDFGDKMVYPLIALFPGTGNQTANVPSALVERLFDDPNMRLWNHDPDTFLPNFPTMPSPERASEFRLNTEVTGILARSKRGALIGTRPTPSGDSNDAPQQPSQEIYDDLVFLPPRRRRIPHPRPLRAAFNGDITLTHHDAEYLNRHYVTEFSRELCAEPKSEEQRKYVAFAKGEDEENPRGFRPMYFTKSYKSDPKKIEMSWDASNYQHQLLKEIKLEGKANVKAKEQQGTSDCGQEYEHVYQSIFLDKRNSELWTIDEIGPSKVIRRQWWHQLGHRWQHYLPSCRPGMMFLNGRNRPLFAGSGTLVNMHELACVSGIAAAYRLGAEYKYFNDFAEGFFIKYLLFSHGLVYSREENKRKRSQAGGKEIWSPIWTDCKR